MKRDGAKGALSGNIAYLKEVHGSANEAECYDAEPYGACHVHYIERHRLPGVKIVHRAQVSDGLKRTYHECYHISEVQREYQRNG